MAEEVNPFAKYVTPASSAPSNGEENPFAKYKKSSGSSGEPDRVSSQSLGDLVTGKQGGQDKGKLAAAGYGAASNVAPGLAGLATGAAAAEVVSPIAAASLAIPGIGPFVAGGIELLAFGGGAIGGSEAASKIQSRLWSLVDPEGFANAQKTMQAHEGYATAGSIAGGAAGLSPKVAIDKTAKWINTAMKARAASAATQAGVSAGSQLATTGEIDLKEVGIAAATGAVLPGTNRLGKPFHAAGTAVGGAIAKPFTKDATSNIDPTKPPEGATPEQKAKWLEEVKKNEEVKNSKAKLVETAIREKANPRNIERMGPKHDEARKLETADTHEQGFIDERGNFLTRKEAFKRAKNTGQVPEDHVLEQPKEGLHSGDLRKAGVKEFEISTEKPAGVSTTDKPPVSRDDFKGHIREVSARIESLNIQKTEAELAGKHDEAAAHEAELQKAQQEHDALEKHMPEVEFKNKEKPTWQELHDHLWNAKNVGEAFDRIAKADIGSPGQKALIKALTRSKFIRSADLDLQNKKIGYHDENNVWKEDASGLYTGNKEHKLSLGEGGNLQVFMHEGIHAGTHALINSGKSNAAIALKRLLALHKSDLGLKADEAMATYKQKYPNVTIGEQKIYREYLEYGIKNEHEFIAEAFTNKEFQQLLSKLPSDMNKPASKLLNVWEEFKKLVADGLGIKDRTALDDVLEQGTKMIEASRNRVPSNKPVSTISTPKQASSVASRFSEELHDLLERNGIAVAHSSPHKFGAFNWIKHALSGEGNMAFGAGTYFSRGDGTNKSYQMMSKDIVGEKYMLDHPEIAQKMIDLTTETDYLDKKIEKVQVKIDDLKRDYLLDELKFNAQDEYESWEMMQHPNLLEGKTASELHDLYDKHIIGARKTLEQYESKIADQKSDLILERASLEAEQKLIQDERRAIDEAMFKETKVPTYHSTIEAHPDELLDWNSNKQSNLIKEAFETLGVSPVARAVKITALHMRELEKQLVASGGHIQSVDVARGKYGIYAQKQPDGSYIGFVREEEEAVAITKDIKASSLKELQNEFQKAFAETPKTGVELYRELSQILKPTFEEAEIEYRKLFPDEKNPTSRQIGKMQEHIGDTRTSIALAEQGVVGQVHNANWGREEQFRNYVVFDDTRVKQNFVELASKGEPILPDAAEAEKFTKDTSPEVAEAIKNIDVRTIPNKASFIEHATELFHTYGEETTLKFFDDYATELKKRSIPIPTDHQGLDDAFHKMTTWEQADTSEHVIGYGETATDGLGKRPSMLHPIERKAWDKKAKAQLVNINAERETAFFAREHGKDVGGHLGEVLKAIDSENEALIKKITAMGGDVGQEFGSGQSRYRIQGGVTSNFKNMVSELFANRMPFSEKVAEQTHAAKERSVFQMDDGRVVELHKHPEDGQFRYQDERGKWQIRNVHKGTEIWEWKNGSKERIGFTEDPNFKLGDSIEIKDRTTKEKKSLTLVDGKVDAIEEHSPYRYLHDAEASARMSNMGLRKMARELELLNNLKESKLFEKVGFSPEKSLKDLPKGWVVPDSLDKIPQLRGWHFDPKTAAIIEDFAKVWDNGMWMKLSNQIVKNMMLNPLPHMFNEVMHLYNARGFTGWVNPISFARFVKTGSLAMKDVAEQTLFYRDVMREGGSILGASPRNGLFDKMIIEAGKQLVDDKQLSRGMGLLAKKLGTTVGGLYNGLSRASQKAMWVSRDVMYMQYIREIQKLHPEMDLKSVIAKAETHMPNYRMPSEVLGSRGLSKALKNPNISMFSRYHYGMVKSLVNTVKDINPANLKSAEGREHFRDGVDSILAIGVAMAVLYPLMDEMAQAVFGEGAEQRRAGPYHLIKAGADVASGEKDVSALIWPVFTFNPVLLTLGELMFNKNIFSGKEIYHPHDKLTDKLGDAAKFAGKQIPQGPAVMGAVAGDTDANMSTLAKQFDIKAKTPAQRAKERTARKRELAMDKARQTRRDKGTYP